MLVDIAVGLSIGRKIKIDKSLASCPRCGATINILVTNQPQHCEYCGTLIRPTIRESDKSHPSMVVKSPDQPNSVLVEGVSLPPEYSNIKRPRPSTPVGAQGIVGIFFGVVWTLFSLVFLVLGLNTVLGEILLNLRVQKEGLVVQGVITKLEIDDSGDSTSYYVNYQFQAPLKGDFTQFNHRQDVSRTTYNLLIVGQKVDVQYASSDANVSRLKSESGRSNLLSGLLFTAVGGFFVLIGMTIAVDAAKSLNQLDQLRQSGLKTQATLIEHWKDKDSDGDPVYFVTYAFQVVSSQGRTRIITRTEQQRKIYEKYQLGDIITVRCLPDNPDVCQILE